MPVKKTNLSDFTSIDVPSASNMKFGIVVSEWNSEITEVLLKGAVDTLVSYGAQMENIVIESVPGSFELSLAGQIIAENNNLDAVICLGCVIQGETRHFEFICQAVSQGINNLNLKFNMPFIFGVLTTDNIQQARDRSGGLHGNKGDEAAVAAIRMAALKKKYL